MTKNFFIYILILSTIIPIFTFAETDKVFLGQTTRIADFVFEDDYTPSTDTCTVSIYDPNGNIKVNEGVMQSNANGWHYYDYTVGVSEQVGRWPVIMSCGSLINLDLVKVNKDFIVEVDNTLSTTTIAQSVSESVWSNPLRVLTDYATSSIASAVWNSSSRTLTDFGTLVADIWSSPTRSLTDYALSAIASAVTSSVWSNPTRDLTNYGNNISADDVWLASNRTLTNYGNSDLATTTADLVWNRASSQLNSVGSIGKLLVDNIDAQISTRGTSSLTALDVWNAGTRSLTSYSESSIATAVTSAVWSNATRELTSYGNDITANDVWSVLISNLTTVNSIGKILADNVDSQVSTRASLTNQQAGWSVSMSDFTTVQTGKTYRAKISVLNSQSIQTNPFSNPTISLYDASRNIIVSNIPMTNVSNGIYEYTYSVPSTADQGVWEAIVSTEVESGKTIITNDYFLVAGSPAQVIINSVSGNIPTAIANLTITNEGLAGYEYQYEWCIVSDINNVCGGGDDVYRGTGAKFINPGEDWNTNLTSTINTPGNYYYKVIVYFGTEKSGSSRTFSIASDTNNQTGGGNVSTGGGGGGSNFVNTPSSVTPIKDVALCNGGDLNKDNKVNIVDFSILLSFWKTKGPYKNICVDINQDLKVNASDFSIMLSQWGGKGKPIKIK